MNVTAQNLSFLATELARAEAPAATPSERVDKAMRAYEAKYETVLSAGQRVDLLAEVSVHLAQREAQRTVAEHPREVANTSEGMLEAIEVAPEAAEAKDAKALPMPHDALVVAAAASLAVVPHHPLPRSGGLLNKAAIQKELSGILGEPGDVRYLTEHYLSFASQVSASEYFALADLLLRSAQPRHSIFFGESNYGVYGIGEWLSIYDAIRQGGYAKGLARGAHKKLQERMMSSHKKASYDERVRLISTVYGDWGLTGPAARDNASLHYDLMASALLAELPTLAKTELAQKIVAWLAQAGHDCVQITTMLALTRKGFVSGDLALIGAASVRSSHLGGLTAEAIRRALDERWREISSPTGWPKGFVGASNSFQAKCHRI